MDLSKRDLKSNTALHYACLNLCEPAALMLLERISEPECIDATNVDLRTYLTFIEDVSEIILHYSILSAIL